MDSTCKKVVIAEADATSLASLQAAMEASGYLVWSASTVRQALEALTQSKADLLLLDASVSDMSPLEALSAIRGSPVTASVRVILLVGPGANERTTGIEMGANDAVSRPWDLSELLARVRQQCRIHGDEEQLRDKARLAEEGQQIAYTAFDAVAVTEKMTNDAVKLDRGLKIGFGAFVGVIVVMAAIYFLFARKAQQETLHANVIIDKLQGGLMHQQDLIAEVRKLRQPEAGAGADSVPVRKDELKKQADEIKTKMAGASAGDISALQKQLQNTNARLKRVEQEDTAAQGIISTNVQSVCMLHVSVAFRHQQSGRRLRYAGLNPNNEPLQDSEGHSILTLDGNGPEVKVDVFGTGFIVGPNGLVETNRHVAEPWWKNDELSQLTGQGFQSEISTIRAYFPGDPRAFHAEIQNVSMETDLATMRVDLQDLKRGILSLDTSDAAAKSGEAIVVMGYATGLNAILARADEETAEKILTRNGGQVSGVLDELARRGLIRPLVTQGHVGDVLPEKIVFDAQTTSGGSGGPLFNEHGKVVGVTYAVLNGFGGSNFAIPIRLSKSLLTP
jgi:DNA-binding response OmpR family regulator/S1-C subfamily serine protease